MKKGIEFYKELNINQKIEVRNVFKISRQKGMFEICLFDLEFKDKLAFLNCAFILHDYGFTKFTNKYNFLKTF